MQLCGESHYKLVFEAKTYLKTIQNILCRLQLTHKRFNEENNYNPQKSIANDMQIKD